MGKIWLFASGKGGVGKSTVAASLAVEFARRGLRCALVDGDVGLRSLDLMLGMQDRILFELSDCAQRLCSLDMALTPHPDYPLLHLFVGGQAARPKDFAAKDVAKMMSTLKNRYEVLLIDGPAGLGRGLKIFAGAADELILVATPDEVCLRDSEKTGMVLWERTQKRPQLLLNRYDTGLFRRSLIKAPAVISAALDLPLAGVFEEDERVHRAMLQGRTMAECGSRRTEAAVRRIAGRLLGDPTPAPKYKRGLFHLSWNRRTKRRAHS